MASTSVVLPGRTSVVLPGRLPDSPVVSEPRPAEAIDVDSRHHERYVGGVPDPPPKNLARMKRVMSVWNWLPAFRVVAEFESVHRAASALAVSPSALSRTIRLAEEALGHPLFLRDPSGLRLTDEGSRVLTATRDAMRLIDDGISSLRASTATSLVLGFTTPLAEKVLLRALAGLPADDSRSLDVRRVAETDVTPELLRGLLDLVVCGSPSNAAEITDLRLGDVPFGLFAPPGVPASAGTSVTLAEGSSRLRAATLEGVELLARARGLLAELPVELAPQDFRAIESTTPTRSETLHVATRKRLGEDAGESLLLGLLRDALRFD